MHRRTPGAATSLATVDAVVESTTAITPTIREIRLRPEGGVVRYLPGSHVVVHLRIDGRDEERHYSLIGLGDGATYRIAVKLDPDGHGGSRAMWALDQGDRIRISAPRNDFSLSYGQPEVLLIAGGIGITPMIGMALALRAHGTPFRLVQLAKVQNELAYADELSAQLGECWRPVVSASDGRIDLPSLLGELNPNGEVYICGPIGLLDAARKAWSALGRPVERLRFESFASSGHFASLPFAVELPRLGMRVTVGIHESIIDALDRAGISLMWDCRRGECGLCAVSVLSVDAVIDHRDVFLSDSERMAGSRICACVSRVVGGTIAIDDGHRERHDIL